MTGGFDYAVDAGTLRKIIEEKNGLATTLDIVKTYAEKALKFEPGERFEYSLCHDILAAVIEVVSGKRFAEYLNEIIFSPLKMTDSTFKETEEIKNRIVDQYKCTDGKVNHVEKSNCFYFTPEYESGGAGLITSVDDYIKFADTMACEGISKDGYRLLKPETIKLLRSEQLSAFAVNPSFSCCAGPGYGYGLGVRTRISHEGGKSPLGEFGWDGAAGCYVMMDCVNHLSIFFAMQVLDWPWCIGSGHAIMRDLVYDALDL